MQILHIMNRLSGAGPTRGAIALAKLQGQLGMPHRHRLAWLAGDPYPMAKILAARAKMSLVSPTSPEALAGEIAAADIVHLHFWNSPDLYRFLSTPWPACRLLVRFTIAGVKPPQIIVSSVVAYADQCSVSPFSIAIPALREAAAEGRAHPVRSPRDDERLDDCQPQPHPGFNVGYVGTVNFSKMHPSFVAMSAAIRVPGLRVVVCGACDTEVHKQVAGLGAEGRFDFRGYVEDLRPVLESLDVFAYPLCEDTFATDEKSLQEAMSAGVPPVVFPHGGVAMLVQHGQTGLVVESEQAYQEAIEWLYAHPEERIRMGERARAYAREHFSSLQAARQTDAIYESLMGSPKRERSWAGPYPEPSPSRHFLATLDGSVPQLELSLAGPNAEAEAFIAASSTLLTGGEGGIFQYRNAYPNDPYLRFWSSLVLRHQQRIDSADRELAAARELGLER